MSDDEQGLGDLFGGADEAPQEYPIEELLVDRHQLSCEGTTSKGFMTLFDRFDSAAPVSRPALSPLRVFFRNKRHSLWGHRLWNAARYLVKRMDSRMIDVRGRTVLELGAGLGVPSLAAFKNGARRVVVTDYPDADLLDIIEQNVRENCKDGDMDEDARTFFLDEAMRIKQMRSGNVHGDSNTGDVENSCALLSEKEMEQATHTRCVVEPLLWGKEEHIQQVLSHTGGASVGFDIVLLSDILFNHVCNADLANTVVRVLQRSPHAAAYCVFSHHRAHKQVEDLEFFDLCVARGLCCEEIDQEEYPLMFPDDRGPEEIRQPVKVYKIVHRTDDAGWALDISSAPTDSSSTKKGPTALPGLAFDVIVQGTGVVEGMISAALARSGLRVLHCDGQSDYGGVFRTLTVEAFREYLKRDAQEEDETHEKEENEKRCEEAQPGEAKKEHSASAVVEVDRMDELDFCLRRRFLIDLLPSHYLSRGETICKLMESDMCSHMEFQRLSGFIFLVSDKSSRNVRAQNVPLTRAAVFSSGSLSLVQKRRLMKFVKDVEAPLAELLHARNADTGDHPNASSFVSRAAALSKSEAHGLFAAEAAAHPGESLSEMIERKYGISGEALDVLTLRRQIGSHCRCDRHSHNKSHSNSSLERDVDVVRQVLTSVGAFGCSMPFLVPAYGTSELAQNMCRVAAVWNATFVLRRSLSRVVVDPSTDTTYAVMSNGQYVRVGAVVVPRALESQFRAELPFRPFCQTHDNAAPHETNASATPMEQWAFADDVQFARVVVIARRPLIEWSALCPKSNPHSAHSHADPNYCMGGASPSGEETDMRAFTPLVLALWEAQPGAMVHVQQQGAASEQAPGECVVLHFTASACDISAATLRHAVRKAFIASTKDVEDAARDSGVIQLAADDVLFFASFVLSEARDAHRGLIRSRSIDETTSETRKAHPYAIAEYRRRASAQFDGAAEKCVDGPLVTVQTVFQNRIDDGAYLEAARQAYGDVLAKLGLESDAYTFLERLPPPPE